MSSNLQKVQPLRAPILPSQTTAEQRYWRGFSNTLLIKESGPINHINFNPISPHDFVVTHGLRIQIFSAKTRRDIHSITRSTNPVYSAEFSHDGKFLIAGDQKGTAKLLNSSDRSVILQVQANDYPLYVTKFHPTSRKIFMTGSDDRVARLYDITSTSKSPINTFDSHTDYVRAGTFIPDSNLVCTGCYDGIVRIFDPRVGNTSSVAEFNHEGRIEDILALNPSTLVSAGVGPAIKAWDIVGGKLIRTMANFQKDVTCLANAGDRGLLAGSADGHVKVFDTTSTNWDVKFGWKFGGPVRSCGVSPDHKHFITGLSTGLMSIRTRKTEPKVKQGVKKPKSSSFARIIRGAEYKGETEQRIINDKSKQNKKVSLFEKRIQQFRWSDALDAAFVPGVTNEQTVTFLNELKKRGKVRVSLYGRDETSLEPLLKWCSKAIEDSRSVVIVADWIGVVIDMFGELVDKSSILEELMYTLKKRTDREIEKAKEAQRIEGMLQLLIK